MREHKYRAWHKTEKKMYEDVAVFHDMAYEYSCTSTPGVGIDGESITPIATRASEIVIMEYTRLNDKIGAQTMGTEEHDLTIQVVTSESYYDGEVYSSATLTFTNDEKTVKLDYD